METEGIRSKDQNKRRSRRCARSELGECNMVSQNTESGFSLLELTFAAALTVVLMIGVFGVMNKGQSVFVAESVVTEMNENVRTALDLVTRDIQTSGSGLTRSTSNNARGDFAAIYYTNGAAGQPDSLLMVNGDPFVPTADVSSHAAGSADYVVTQPSDMTVSSGPSGIQFFYTDRAGNQQRVYRTTANDPQKRRYIVYDDTHLRVFSLTQDGSVPVGSNPPKITLTHNAAQEVSPAALIGSAIDTEEPVYAEAKIAALSSLVGYRLDTNTGELMRTDDLITWYSVARGIVGFQVQYRTIAAKGAPDVVLDAPPQRRSIHSLIVTIVAETPDLSQTDRR